MTTARAPRNKTLTLSQAERCQLRAKLIANPDEMAEKWLDHTLWADTLEALRHLPDACADLVIADPPYNLSKRFGQMAFTAMSHEQYGAYVDSWFHEVCKKLKPHATLYLCGDWRAAATLQRAMESELTLLNRITWQREKGRGTQRNWKNCQEDIWYGVKDAKNYCFNAEAVMMKRRVLAPYRSQGQPKDWHETDNGKFRLTYPSNFWDDITVPFWSMAENTDHPTQKPEKLIAKLILASSNEGDVVLDPFLGSGTTSVVAKKLGRHYCGIEQNEEYCLYAEKRLLLSDTDKRIQGLSDGTFWERNCKR